jgi:hypothetical protein
MLAGSRLDGGLACRAVPIGRGGGVYVVDLSQQQPKTGDLAMLGSLGSAIVFTSSGGEVSERGYKIPAKN